MLPAMSTFPQRTWNTLRGNGSFFKMYTNTGIVNIDPPAPINPSDKPILRAATPVSNSLMILSK